MAVPGARAALPARRAPVLLAGPVAAAGFSTATAELAAPVDKEWSEVREAPVVGPGSGAPVVPVGPGAAAPSTAGSVALAETRGCWVAVVPVAPVVVLVRATAGSVAPAARAAGGIATAAPAVAGGAGALSGTGGTGGGGGGLVFFTT